uniref:Tyr recombinase domain-containing protein n=1 Tax=Amphimedon queenslandica TaxID=400682 RepID=A0A1X7T011_AMPQE
GLFEQGLASSSNRTYSSAKSCYFKFCRDANLSPYPLSQGTICLFAAFLAQRGLSPGSISTYLSAVRHLDIQSSASTTPRSAWPYLQYVLRGIKRSSQGGPLQRARLPITPAILHQLHLVWDPRSSFLHLLLWTTASVAFFGFLRLGEVTATPGSPPSILAESVAIDSHQSPSIIRLTVSRSKTDQFGKGAWVVLGKTDDDLCPVSALLAYLARRPGPRVGPLLIQEDGQPLTRDFFVHLLKEALGRCGIDSGGYSGHSFRIGAATSAAQAGVPDHIIKAMGRWESEAYQTYIRSSPSTLAAVASSLAGSIGRGTIF